MDNQEIVAWEGELQTSHWEDTKFIRNSISLTAPLNDVYPRWMQLIGDWLTISYPVPVEVKEYSDGGKTLYWVTALQSVYEELEKVIW